MAEVHLTEVLYNGCWSIQQQLFSLSIPKIRYLCQEVLTSMKGMRQSCGKTEKGYGALLL